jgi:hypothetical protein
MADKVAEAFLIELVDQKLINVFQLLCFFHVVRTFLVQLAEKPETAHQAVVGDQFIHQFPELFLAHVVVNVTVDVTKLFDLCHIALN